MRTPPDTDRSERGTAAVEFALVLPLVLVVALAVVQTGLLVRDGAVDLAVTREGVRGEPVTVSVRYLASIRVPFVVWLFGDAVGMTTSTTARQEFG
jgi:hypothetical protein